MKLDDALLQARILIVDDQPANVKLLEKLLRSCGFANLALTTDPREAVALYAKHRPDLVLLDIRMPHLDGYEVMEALKQVEGSFYIPVLVLTAQADAETKIKALEYGARDFLTKPFDRLEIISRLRNLLEIRLLHNEITQQNLLLEERVRARTAELHHTRLDVIRRLGRASEYRDNETGLHILRMSRFTELLAIAAGVDNATRETLVDASPMHDLGKLGIPDRILLKPGPLDAAEWQVMQTHTLIGAELLSGSDSDLLSCARTIALTHHEKWDGSGYPNRLCGREIPLAGRITALADVFDALTSRRPYKRAWSVEEATAEITAQSGRHFDPDLVPLFRDQLPEWVAVQKAHAEIELTHDDGPSAPPQPATDRREPPPPGHSR